MQIQLFDSRVCVCLLGKTLFGWKYSSHGSEPIVEASQGKRYVIVSESP
jgi:hypothetical protein